LKKQIRKLVGVEYTLILVALFGLLSIGVLAVMSASAVTSMQQYGNAYTIFLKQILFILIGLGLLYVGLRLSFESWEKLGRLSFLIGFGILFITTIFGKNVNGNRNWIPIGPFLIQPSEFAKLSLILFCAFQLKKLQAKDLGSTGLLIAVGPISFIFIGLILVGRDMGTALIIAGIAFCLLVIAGIEGKFILPFLGLGLLGAATLVFGHQNRLKRFKAFLNPFAPDVYKFAGWQPAHSLMGLASGGLLGVGIGESKQKWANLAEAHTDFIFSVIGEEMGLLGTMLVVCFSAAMIWGIFRTAIKAKDPFQKFVVAGIGCWFTLQFLANIATNVSLAPVIGVTLPFISYGGSSIIANLTAIGFVLKVAFVQAGVVLPSRSSKRIGS
jgi:cell division protein FtsW